MTARSDEEREDDKSRRQEFVERDEDGQIDEELLEEEAEHVEERSTPPTPVIYEVIRHHGEIEMARPAVSLWWSGVAAGLSISFSVIAQAVMRIHLPEAEWTALLSTFGYSFGFLMVMLARQQLFTENTITAVLPIVADPSLHNLLQLGRMWSVVLAANLAGTFLAALFATFTPVVTPEIYDAMLAIGEKHVIGTWPQMFFGGIAAGFLIATLVWIIPSAGSAQILVIPLITWLIAAGGFAHIVAGSVEAFLLLLDGQWGVGAMVLEFGIPVLLGNIVGGTVLFTMLSYAQVMREIRTAGKD